MATEIISSSSEVFSSNIRNEIEPIENPGVSSSPPNTFNEIATTQNQNSNEENAKLSSATHPKAKHSLRTCCLTSKVKITETNRKDNTNSKDDPTTSNPGHNEVEALSNWIDADLSFIRKASETIQKYEAQGQIEEAGKRLAELKNNGNRDDLRELKKFVRKLKQQISSRNKDGPDGADPHQNTLSTDSAISRAGGANKLFDEMPKLYKSTIFEQSSAFKDLQARYDALEPTELKLCLLCFSVFPENVTITKRLMIYWWIGEGFVRPTPQPVQTAEKLASVFFKKLIAYGFIEPVNEKRSLAVDRCRMHPFIRSAVIMFAERAKFFDFDSYGNLTEEFSCSLRACLVGKGLSNIQDLDKLHMVFNVNESILEFKPEWFMKMRNVNVLYLGRWQTSATHHIEVEDTKFLDGLMAMNHLRFFSLQGVSRITELPDSISKLTSLRILDLRACHNLEAIPEGIDCLKSLTHLDMSECYLLDHMPKGLKSLSELLVLNGFVFSKSKNSCTLAELATLGKLRKLSIYTGVKEFPTNSDLRDLSNFKNLRKLTIAWGRGSLQKETKKSATQAKEPTESMEPATSKEAKDAAKSTPDTPQKEKDAAKSTVQDPPQQEKDKHAKDEAKSTAGETAKQVRDTAKLMGPDTASQPKDEAKTTAGETKQVIDEAKATVGETAKQVIDEAKSTAGETAKQVKDAAKSMSPDATKKAENKTKSTASEITKAKNKGSSQAETDNDAKQESSSRNPTASDTPKGENIGENKMKGDSAAKRPLVRIKTLIGRRQGGPDPIITLPELEKLDLQCFPETITPSWLKPANMTSLKKLYIRGGKFSDLGQFQELDDEEVGQSEKKTWAVEELRLKYLSELKMDWRELQGLFPNLNYLEKVSCPKLTFFPCDGKGVWIKKNK